MKVAIISYSQAILSSVTGPYDIFSKTNEILKAFNQEHKCIPLQVSIIDLSLSDEKDKELSWNIKPGQTQQLYDLVIIPAMNFDKVQEVLNEQADMMEWIRWQYQKGAEIASICLGAFILAAAGLLDHKKATTHWLGAEAFRKMFPQVQLLDDKIITDHDKIYTSGGAFSFTSLMIYLVEKYFDREVAILISKVFMIHLHESVQSSFAIFNLQKNHQDQEVLKIQKWIDQHYNREIHLAELADKSHVSVRTLIRRFKKATGSTPYEYVQKVRIEQAKKLLEAAQHSIERISSEVGYSDFASFRKIFKRQVGITPTGYRRRYGNMFLPSITEKQLDAIM
ncbi:MAG: GlxA family transcriptional regulator [Candidatus Cyclobacteriaceae bacterium M3_2C_046]